MSGFSNTNTIIMVSIFIVAEALGKTQMVKRFSNLIYKVSSGSMTKILAGYVLLTCILAQFVSSSIAVFGIMFPIALTMCENTGIKPSKIMFSIGITAIGTVDTLPTGGGAILVSQYNGYLETYEYANFLYSPLDMCIGRLPILIAIVFMAIFIIPKFAPDLELLESMGQSSSGKRNEKTALNSIQEVLGYSIFGVVILGLIFQNQIGIPGWQIAFAGAVLTVITGVLAPEEAYRAVRPEITLLYIGYIGHGKCSHFYRGRRDYWKCIGGVG